MSDTVGAPPDKTADTYRDSAGRTLTDYPRPSVAVDTAVLTVIPLPEGRSQLAVLQVRRSGNYRQGSWALPGMFLHEGERLLDAVHRSLRDKAGTDGVAPIQLHVFDDPARDERGRVLSIAHVDVIPQAQLVAALHTPGAVRLTPAAAPGPMPYDHTTILNRAVTHLQRRYQGAPDPHHLLTEPFTLRELRLVHEAVAGHPLQRDTFRRAMAEGLEPTGRLRTGTRGKPAELFVRGSARDGEKGCGRH